ncbi:hypothetical protein TH25_22165 [Thalassospira profundimaris]|uniref:Uncharacterized protein n=1 Tax=Thalassospira profundimaris TaxID=502049 RepID=A0A367WNW4_9PROT|nr:hypothetical protein [Thalassospira profundimaris]RCK43143.1 hypothetical protein TH25_22165 [Thalassospira profundimaris]
MKRVLSQSILWAMSAVFLLCGTALADAANAASDQKDGTNDGTGGQPNGRQVQILDTQRNVEISGEKGQLARLTNPQTGIKEMAVLMQTADLDSQPIMIAMRLAHPLAEAELAYFDKNSPGNVSLSASCREVLVAKMPSGRHVAQGNQCNIVEFY